MSQRQSRLDSHGQRAQLPKPLCSPFHGQFGREHPSLIASSSPDLVLLPQLFAGGESSVSEILDDPNHYEPHFHALSVSHDSHNTPLQSVPPLAPPPPSDALLPGVDNLANHSFFESTLPSEPFLGSLPYGFDTWLYTPHYSHVRDAYSLPSAQYLYNPLSSGDVSMNEIPHDGVDLSRPHIHLPPDTQVSPAASTPTTRESQQSSSSVSPDAVAGDMPHEMERIPSTSDACLDRFTMRIQAEKSYTCNYPGCMIAKLWRSREGIRAHVRQHLGETSLYRCKNCNKTFASWKNAARHRDNQGRQHACPKCDGVYTRIDYRNKHMKKCKGKK